MRGRLLDIKEKMIVFGVITGIFLPVRMMFYTYISPHWIGSLGVVSSLMIVMILLAHKNKLGYFGNLFIKQITKTIKGKAGKISVILSLVLIAYFGSTLVWIERGNTIYHDEKQIISQTLFSGKDINKMESNDVNKIMNISPSGGLLNASHVNYIDQVISMTYAIMNDMMGGWLINFDIILLVEQLEFLGFVIIYRKLYASSKTMMVNNATK